MDEMNKKISSACYFVGRCANMSLCHYFASANQAQETETLSRHKKGIKF